MRLLPKLGTDRDWERLAQDDPFWAVAGGEQFHKDNLNDEVQREFFASGERYIASVFDLVRKHLDPAFAPRTALDFGCGLGRLTIPLARRTGFVTGVDVAETMLREALGWLERFQIGNVKLCKSDDSLSAVRGPFDLIHSYIVFQHIAPHRGEAILRHMLDHMQSGSVGVLHFLYGLTRNRLHTTWREQLFRIKERIWLVYRSLLGRPAMQMNEYHLNALFRILQEAGIRRFHIELSDHGGAYGAVIYFQKSESPYYLA
jgi:2-polyprenyl-3-methyl-5-hydroxy-6-metoxy-1,4-benzoquinol methylase